MTKLSMSLRLCSILLVFNFLNCSKYDSLTKEELVTQINILKKSKHMKSRIVKEGKLKRNINDNAGNIEKMLPASLVMTLVK